MTIRGAAIPTSWVETASAGWLKGGRVVDRGAPPLILQALAEIEIKRNDEGKTTYDNKAESHHRFTILSLFLQGRLTTLQAQSVPEEVIESMVASSRGKLGKLGKNNDKNIIWSWLKNLAKPMEECEGL